MESVRFLLLQIRRPNDPIIPQERTSFATALGCRVDAISTRNLTVSAPTASELSWHDLVLIGGSGDFSVLQEEAWLDAALETMRTLYALRKPTFGSCWGFQAIAQALGGKVVHDPSLAELGTPDALLTEEGRRDPVFGQLSAPFPVLSGHEDTVVVLPPGAVNLAFTEQVAFQAYRFEDAPILATQFHAELSLPSYLERVRAYPRYIRQITGLEYADFARQCRPPHKTGNLLRNFVRSVLVRPQA